MDVSCELLLCVHRMSAIIGEEHSLLTALEKDAQQPRRAGCGDAGVPACFFPNAILRAASHFCSCPVVEPSLLASGVLVITWCNAQLVHSAQRVFTGEAALYKEKPAELDSHQ